jgi:hypothetical protein
MDGKPGTQSAPVVNADHARPRFGVMTDAQVAKSVASHHKMVERTSNAWQKPAPQRDVSPIVRNAAARDARRERRS